MKTFQLISNEVRWTITRVRQIYVTLSPTEKLFMEDYIFCSYQISPCLLMVTKTLIHRSNSMPPF
jgi:hypothetical protein